MTKQELITAIQSLGVELYSKQAMSTKSKPALECLLGEAQEAARKEAKVQERKARIQALDEALECPPPRIPHCVATSLEDYRALEQATYRFNKMLYHYNQRCHNDLLLAANIRKLTRAWEAFQAGTVFPNGLTVAESDITDLIAFIGYHLFTLERIPEV